MDMDSLQKRKGLDNMITSSDKPIFIQLAEVIKTRIIDNVWRSNDRIPSIRELAAEFEVNNNTAMHTIETLARENIIYQKRGIGYFVTQDAKDIIRKQRHLQFNQEVLPILKKSMQQLDISKEDLLNML